MTEAVIDTGFDRSGILEKIGDSVPDSEGKTKVTVHFFVSNTEEIDVDPQELKGLRVGDSVIVTQTENGQSDSEYRLWKHSIRRQ